MPEKYCIQNGKNYYNISKKDWVKENEATIFVIPKDDEIVFYLIKDLDTNKYWSYPENKNDPNQWVYNFYFAAFLTKEYAEKIYKELVKEFQLNLCLEIYFV